MLDIKELNTENIKEIKELFCAVFTAPPWNDDWSNEEQLHKYIYDLIGNPNSLTFGLFQNDVLVGISMGHIKHWYSGTEYYIDEFCIKTEMQGYGLGKSFLSQIEDKIKQIDIVQIFLQTEKSVPAYEFYKKNGFVELKGHVSFVKEV